MPSDKLTINKEFAAAFQRRKEREELDRLKAKYPEGEEGDSSSSSSSDDDEDFDSEFLCTLSAIKSGDLSLCKKRGIDESKDDDDDDDDDDDEDDEDEDEEEEERREKKRKPMFIKDYERKVITEREGKLSDDDSDEDRPRSPSYYEIQEKTRKEFAEAFAVGDEDGDEEDLLQPKVRNKEEEKPRAESCFDWLKGENVEIDESLAKDLVPLMECWNDPNLDEKDKYLKNFILNKTYQSTGQDEGAANYDDILKEAEEDEKEYEQEELFDYAHRFEEPDKEFIKYYPRMIPDSVRPADTRRSEKRQKVKERKLAEKLKKQEEIKHLKNLKKKELEAKWKQVKEIAGTGEVNVPEEYLDEDFEPETHDSVMQKLIGEDYYDNDEDVEKPQIVMDDLDDIEEAEDWDHWTGVPVGQEGEELGAGPSNMAAGSSKSADQQRTRNKKKSKFAEAVEKRKPVFDPNEKSFEKYMDEYYRLDYEDLIDGVPCRFNYRKVVPCDFGLSVDEILSVPDRELNAWCPVKKACQYRTEEEEIYDAKIFKIKAKSQQKKLNIMPSLRPGSSSKSQDSEQEKESQAGGSSTPHSKKKKRKNRNHEEGSVNKKPRLEGASEEPELHSLPAEAPRSKKDGSTSGRKNKKRYDSSSTAGQESLTEDGNDDNERQRRLESEVAMGSGHGSRKGIKLSKSNKKSKEATDGSTESQPEQPNSEGQRGKNAGKKQKKPKVPRMSDDRLEAYGIPKKKFIYVHLNKLHREMKSEKDL